MIDYDNLSPVQQVALDTRYYACISGPCGSCPLYTCGKVRKNENGYLDCNDYCVEHPDEALELFAQASAKIADTAIATADDGAKKEQVEEPTAKEENNVNLKDYTPEQLMAGGATEIYCQGTVICDSCPLHEIDGGERPIHCFGYATRYPDEVLKALGVELPEEITPERNDALRAEYEELLEKQRLLMEEIDTKRVELDCLDKATETKTTPMTRAGCLDKAKACVCGQREQDYGSPEDNFQKIANLWGAYQCCEYTTQDVAVMMALLKIARIGGGNATTDSWVDLAGYAACGCEITTGGTS